MGGVKIAFKYKFDIPIVDQDNAINGKSDTICESTHKFVNFSKNEFKQNDKKKRYQGLFWTIKSVAWLRMSMTFNKQKNTIFHDILRAERVNLNIKF